MPAKVKAFRPMAGRCPGIKGSQLRRSNFSKPWARALAKAGLSAAIHVRDLRHTGNTLTAEAGALLAELMPDFAHDRGVRLVSSPLTC